MKKVIIEEYNPHWSTVFNTLSDGISPYINEHIVSIEHVGSTSVEGLCAKPIIDIDIIVPSKEKTVLVIQQLERLGYQHLGDLGIQGREAFSHPKNMAKHNLYVCLEGCLALRNHLTLKNMLTSDHCAMIQYGELKKALASRYENDIDAYVEGKTHFIISLLRKNGAFMDAELDEIVGVNKR